VKMANGLWDGRRSGCERQDNASEATIAEDGPPTTTAKWENVTAAMRGARRREQLGDITNAERSTIRGKARKLHRSAFASVRALPAPPGDDEDDHGAE